jgi:DNA-binding SARP family transcriptional activator
MQGLQIYLFGGFRVIQGESKSMVKLTYSSQALLAYLLLQRHRNHPRDLLVGVFWGQQSQKQARRCLNTALWRLRQALEPEEISAGNYLLTGSTGEISLDCESNCWLDIAIFETQVSSVLAIPIQSMAASDVETLEQALQLYTGELLEGFYEDWVLFERERLRTVYLNGQAHLMQYYRYQGAFKESLACAKKILDKDPLREEIHRETMHLYLENGQRALAVRQYQACAQILATELDIPPMEETQMLYQQLLQTTPEPPRGPSGYSKKLNGNEQLLLQLQLSVREIDKTLSQLRQAVGLAETLPEY